MLETPGEVRETIDRISTGEFLRTRSGIASLAILALGFLIPVLVMLPVWAASQDGSVEAGQLGDLLMDAIINGGFGGALNAIPFALCAGAAFWHLRPSDRPTRKALPGLLGLLVGGIGLFASSIYLHADLWRQWFAPGGVGSTFGVSYFVVPVIGGVPFRGRLRSRMVDRMDDQTRSPTRGWKVSLAGATHPGSNEARRRIEATRSRMEQAWGDLRGATWSVEESGPARWAGVRGGWASE